MRQQTFRTTEKTVYPPARFSGILQHMPLVPTSEPPILGLYYSVVALAQGSRNSAFRELKAAIQKQVERARAKAAKVALIAAIRTERRAFN